MDYRIVVDSCGELTEEMKASGKFVSVAMTILVDNYAVADDSTFSQADFLKKVAASPECPKSACASPEQNRLAFSGKGVRVYGVTLSSELSGSYNSAMVGMQLCLEEEPGKEIYVFNSRSASVGETLIAAKIMECEEKGMAFAQVVETVEAYIQGQNTHFVLESLDTLRKNGRLTGIKALVATALNIKPVMGATPEGTIIQVSQTRGIKKALVKMVECVVAEITNPEDKLLGIANCNCRERAEEVKHMILERVKVKDVVIVDTRGISSLYAGDGGIIVVA